MSHNPDELKRSLCHRKLSNTPNEDITSNMSIFLSVLLFCGFDVCFFFLSFLWLSSFFRSHDIRPRGYLHSSLAVVKKRDCHESRRIFITLF